VADRTYRYVIVGGGLAGASAVESIRERDQDGTILLLGNEKHLPYHRPPLSKKLWTGQKNVSQIRVHDFEFYDEKDIDLEMGIEVVAIDPVRKTVTESQGASYTFEKLLLATGGVPRRLSAPGGDIDCICYYRTIDDYLRLRHDLAKGRTAAIVGGGYIGSEIAAALNGQGIEVTLIMHGSWPARRIFPEGLGMAIKADYIAHGVRFIDNDEPARIDRIVERYAIQTKEGERLESDILIVGVGIDPATGLARKAGLEVGDGVVVDECLRTSHPDIYAAGDIAFFPYKALGVSTRIEHWDNALNQGRIVGRNMAGAREPYDYMPYFFSDMFEFGFEAVGDVDAGLDTFADWQEENAKGVIYYLRDGQVRGVMMCNVWDKVDAARALIRKGGKVSESDLRGAIGVKIDKLLESGTSS